MRLNKSAHTGVHTGEVTLKSSPIYICECVNYLVNTFLQMTRILKFSDYFNVLCNMKPLFLLTFPAFSIAFLKEWYSGELVKNVDFWAFLQTC